MASTCSCVSGTSCSAESPFCHVTRHTLSHGFSGALYRIRTGGRRRRRLLHSRRRVRRRVCPDRRRGSARRRRRSPPRSTAPPARSPRPGLPPPQQVPYPAAGIPLAESQRQGRQMLSRGQSAATRRSPPHVRPCLPQHRLVTAHLHVPPASAKASHTNGSNQCIHSAVKYNSFII